MPITPPRTPIFVDASGRRARWAGAAFLTVGGLALLYVATVALSLVLPAGTLHLTVPGLGPVLAGPAPAPVSGRDGDWQRKLATLLSTGGPYAAAAEQGGSPGPGPSANPVSGPAPVASAVPVSGSPATPTQKASSRPTGQPPALPSPRSTGRPAVSSRPTPRATPSPARGNGRSRSLSPHPSSLK